ncbi:MAG: TRAP transporter permease DctQ [Ideonella sp. MAG2]|nr:MAG: TRAP transporter permease DctQ [Ideonella sp. MAG2]
MRRLLDLLYEASAWLAALLMVGTLLVVLAGLLNRVVPLPLAGFDAMAGYMVAAAGFLALAHTLKRGDHVRVTVLLHSVGPLQRRILELLCLTVALGLSGVLAWHATEMAWASWAAGRISPHPDRTLLWLPQSAMAFGVAVFCVALFDEWCRAIDARPVEVVSHFDLDLS